MEAGMLEKRPYEKMKFYQQICQMRKFVYETTKGIEKSHLRLVSQMRDAARSSKQNIREGYRKGTIGEYINGLRISLGSLEELSGDIEDCYEDNLIDKEDFNKFCALYQSVTYMTGQYLKSLYKIEREGTWRIPGSKLRKGNFTKPNET
jgi:four helix bundle protein